jgi:hypothetical protein
MYDVQKGRPGDVVLFQDVADARRHEAHFYGGDAEAQAFAALYGESLSFVPSHIIVGKGPPMPIGDWLDDYEE